MLLLLAACTVLISHLLSSLFFTDYHEDLVHTLRCLLKPDGVFLSVAPLRGHSTGKFIACAEGRFSCSVRSLFHSLFCLAIVTDSFLCAQLEEHYHEPLWELHQRLLRTQPPEQYRADIHYPRLLTLRLLPTPAE